jgi:hypothetical protein
MDQRPGEARSGVDLFVGSGRGGEGFVLVEDRLIKLAFTFGNDSRHGSISADIHCSSHHIQESINANNQRNTFYR